MIGHTAQTPLVEIVGRLKDDMPALAERLLGKPSQRSANQYRYGRRGSLVIELRGSKTGLWHDKERDVGGDPIGLIKDALACDFTTAVDYAKRFLGIIDGAPLPPPKARRQTDRAGGEDARKLAALKTIIAELQPVAGTPADEYLARRAIKLRPLPNGVYWRPKAWSDEIGALVVVATDATGTAHAAQSIYLTGDGRKATLDVQKRTNGTLAGTAVRLEARVDGGPIVLSEGPETALSIWQATGYETWACLGISNLGKAHVPPDREIVVARDADAPGSAALATANKAVAALVARGLSVRVSIPPRYEGLKKTDFNDVLQVEGEAAVRALIDGAPFAPSGKPSGRSGPHFTGPTESRDAALERQAAAISAWFTGAERLVRAWREVDELRAQAFEAEGLNGDFAFMDEADRKKIAQRKRQLTQRIRADVAKAAGYAKLPAYGDRVLVTGAQGTGKTSAVLERLATIEDGELVAWILEPTLEKAEEIAAAYAKVCRPTSLPLRVIRGRAAWDPAAEPDDDGRQPAMCPRHRVAEKLAAHGLSVQEKLCDNKATGSRCPHFETCGYQRQRREIAAEPRGIFVGSHEYAFVPAPATVPEIVIVDESIVPRAASRVEFDPSRIVEAGAWHKASAEHAADYQADAPKILEALTEHPGNEIGRLREVGIGEEHIDSALKYLRTVEEDAVADIDPDMSDSQILGMLSNIEESELHKVAIMLRQIRREMATGRTSLSSVTFEPNATKTIDGKTERLPRVAAYYVRRPQIADGSPLLTIDGTGSVALNRKIWGERLEEVRIAVERDAEIVQVAGKTFSRQSITGLGTDGQAIRPGEATALRNQIATFVAKLGGNVFVASSKQVEDTLREILPATAKTGHFGALRGINAFEDCDTAVVVGREQISPQALERQVRAFVADDAEPLLLWGCYVEQCRGRRMRDGSTTWEVVQVHPDPRCQELLEQIREAEIVQALDRVRPVFNRRRLYILTNVVADVTVDRIVPWRELAAGGNIWSRAWAACGGVLPLSPAWLCEHLPEIFSSERTAKRQVSDLISKFRGNEDFNKGANPQIDIIIWDLAPLHEYRVTGVAGRPQLALVRPDLAQTPHALEATIGAPVAALRRVNVSRPAQPPAAAQEEQEPIRTPATSQEAPSALLTRLVANAADSTRAMALRAFAPTTAPIDTTYDAVFDSHGLDPFNEDDRAEALRIWIRTRGGDTPAELTHPH